VDKFSPMEVLEKFYQAIISFLPMRDRGFIATLQKENLLPYHTQSSLQSMSTSKEMASYFLDNIIKPELMKGVLSSYYKLLTVMMESSNDNLKVLATVIKSELVVDNAKGTKCTCSIPFCAFINTVMYLHAFLQ